jgi:hypothetical protein
MAVQLRGDAPVVQVDQELRDVDGHVVLAGVLELPRPLQLRVYRVRETPVPIAFSILIRIYCIHVVHPWGPGDAGLPRVNILFS